MNRMIFVVMGFLLLAGLVMSAHTQYQRDGTEEGDALELAIAHNDLEGVRGLVKGGANLNCRIHEAMTPLMMAVAGKNEEMVECLLDNGADPDFAGMGGYTPLHLAVGVENERIVTLLLRHGAHATLRDQRGWTAADVAKQGKFAGMEAMLLVKQDDVH